MSNKLDSQGFTIVELIVVIVVIAILVTVTALGLSKIKENALSAEYNSKVTTIMSALEKYYDQNGEYPINSDLNPDRAVPTTNFTPLLSILKGTSVSDFKASNDHSFISYCTSADTAGCPPYSNALWNDVFSKSFIYVSRFNNTPTNGSSLLKISQTKAFALGWGCSIKTYYNNPGFVIAWRNDNEGIWYFYRSKHGNIDIENNGTRPAQPDQTCTFSYP